MILVLLLNYFFIILAAMINKFTKALLIDDDNINNYLSKEVISGTNLVDEVIVFTNGHQGLQYFKDSSLSTQDKILILLDLNMPVMDGLEFLNQFGLIKHPYKFLIVILTSLDNQSDKERIKKYNIEHFIAKPITEEKLLRILSPI